MQAIPTDALGNLDWFGVSWVRRVRVLWGCVKTQVPPLCTADDMFHFQCRNSEPSTPVLKEPIHMPSCVKPLLLGLMLVLLVTALPNSSRNHRTSTLTPSFRIQWPTALPSAPVPGSLDMGVFFGWLIYLGSWINWGAGCLGLARVFRLERESLNMARTSYTEL